MQDIYAAIVGEPPTEREKIEALAKKLRGQSMIGQLGQLTGDKVLAPMGRGIGEQAQGQTDKISGLQARARELSAQEAMRAASSLDRAKEAELGRAHDYDILGRRQSFEAGQSALSRSMDRELAKLKADGEDGYTDLKFNDIRKVTTDVAEANAVSDVVSNFKDEYAGTGILGGRGVSNWAASRGMGTQDMKDAQRWWADWDRAYTLPVRNEMFGAALTTSEQKAWEKANISPDMTPAQIRAATGEIERIKRAVLERERDTLKTARFNPDQVDRAFGSGGSPTAPAPDAGAASGEMTFKEFQEARARGEL